MVRMHTDPLLSQAIRIGKLPSKGAGDTISYVMQRQKQVLSLLRLGSKCWADETANQLLGVHKKGLPSYELRSIFLGRPRTWILYKDSSRAPWYAHYMHHSMISV